MNSDAEAEPSKPRADLAAFANSLTQPLRITRLGGEGISSPVANDSRGFAPFGVCIGWFVSDLQLPFESNDSKVRSDHVEDDPMISFFETKRLGYGFSRVVLLCRGEVKPRQVLHEDF